MLRHDIALGVSGTWTDGIAEAYREWVAFPDDDLWAPNKLALQLLAAEEKAGVGSTPAP